MLSDTQIKKAVIDGRLTVKYAFLPDQEGNYHERRPPADAALNAEATSYFESKVIRSRLSLTVGPLLKPLSRARHVRRAHQFSGQSEIVDLRKCPDGWALLPGQSVVLFAGEYVKFPGDLVGLVTGRVSALSSGLVAAAAHIDSTWDGLLQLHLTNTSKRPIRIYQGLEIGRLFLFETQGSSDIGVSISTQGLHFGYTWPRILDDGVDPFTKSSGTRSPGLLGRVDGANAFLQRYAGFGVAALLASAAATGWVVYGDLTSALSLGQQVAQQGITLDRVTKTQPISGSESVTLTANQTEVQHQIELPAGTLYRGTDSYVTANISGDPGNAYLLTSVQQRDGRLYILVLLRVREQTAVVRSYNVGWFYAP